MRNLARPLFRLLGRDDRGAIGVLVAVLIGGGVLLGMGALAIDVGQIYQNRAELQNGADAAALGIARQCSQGACPGSPVSLATTFASDNASALTQDTAKVDCIHGSDGLSAGSCAGVAGGGGLTNCPPDPPAGTHFVDVQTETGTASNLLPPVFAETLVGSSTYNGTTVKACAQAEWGQGNTLALTLWQCQYQDLTGSGGGGFNVTMPVYIKGHDVKPCSGPAGQNAPGAFDWLTTTPAGLCTAALNLTTDTAQTGSSPGASVSDGCKTALQEDIDAKASVFMPVFGCPNPPVTGCPVTGTGSGVTYYIIGLANFVVVGYSDLSGQGNTGPKQYGDYSLCTDNDPCLEGYFTPGLSPISDYGTSAANIVKLTG
jgi:hypothetical protein